MHSLARRFVTTACLACGLFSPVSGPAFGPTVLVNSNGISDAGDDRSPSITRIGTNSWMAVWQTTETLQGAPSTGDWDIVISTSADGGQTWTTPAAVNSNYASDTSDDCAPQIKASAAGTVITVWQSIAAGGDSEICFARRTGTGIWSSPAPLNTDAPGDNREDVQPQIATDNSGNWVVVWSGNSSGTDGAIYCARSSDDGVAWTTPVDLTAASPGAAGDDQYPSIETDGAGHWIAVWPSAFTFQHPYVGTYSDLYISRSTDLGATWTTPAVLHQSGGCFYTATGYCRYDALPKIVWGGGGNWLALWANHGMSHSQAISDIAYSVSNDDAGTWTPAAPLVRSILVGTIALAGDSNLLLAWEEKDLLGPDFDILASSGGITDIAADLSVTKSGPSTVVKTTNKFWYGMLVRNNGPYGASAVTVTDALPEGLSFVSGTATQGSVSESAGTVTAELGTMSVGSTATVGIQVLATTPGYKTNIASVASRSADPEPSNDASAPVVTLVKDPTADVGIAKSSSQAVVAVTDMFWYTMLVTNHGPDPTAGVTVGDQLPPGLAFISASTTQGDVTHSGGVVHASLGTLDAGATATVRVCVQAVAPGTKTNTANVSGSLGDPNPSNNVSGAVVVDVRQPSDLAVSMVDSPDPIPTGTVLTYVIAVTNSGQGLADNVVITDTLPAGVTYLGATTSQGTILHSGGQVTGKLGSIGSGVVATVVVMVRADTVGTVMNNVSAATSGIDPNPSNNTASATTAITAGTGSYPDLTALLSNLGQTVRSTRTGLKYTLRGTITFVNQGSAQAPATTANVYLSGSATPIQTFSLSRLAAGRTARKRLSLTLPAAATGQSVIVVIDPANTIPETNEANNRVTGGPL